jgi:SAM-dependent methyltransferase
VTSDADFLLDLLGGKCRAQAVSTAADLGIADQLAAGPMTTEALAAAVRCDAAALESLLMLLAGLGLLECPAPGVFALTGRGQALRAEALGPLATFVGSAEQWDPWSRLRDAMRGGANAFRRTHGQDLYPFLAGHEAAARRYDAAVDAFTRHEAAMLCAGFDFAPVGSVVDVGGGQGTLLLEILERHPRLCGVLFDLPHVVERARSRLQARAPGRAEVRSGDFLEAVPAGADVYLLKHVLHNWPDEQALRLLQNCARARSPGGRVLVVEAILSPDPRPDLARLLDLEMLVLTGGRERRKPELRRLLHAAGLSLEHVRQLGAAAWLLVGA